MIAGSLGAYLGYFKPHKEAVDAYNVVVGDIQEKNDQLDGEIKKLQELVDNENKPLDETTIDAAKEALKNAGASKIVIGEMLKSTKDILSKTKELSAPVDYSDELYVYHNVYLGKFPKAYKDISYKIYDDIDIYKTINSYEQVFDNIEAVNYYKDIYNQIIFEYKIN